MTDPTPPIPSTSAVAINHISFPGYEPYETRAMVVAARSRRPAGARKRLLRLGLQLPSTRIRPHERAAGKPAAAARRSGPANNKMGTFGAAGKVGTDRKSGYSMTDARR